MKELFLKLFLAKTESEVEAVIKENPLIFLDSNWYPIGANDSNFGIIENQQSNPIAALVEKITNSIDATLMKKCLEAGIDPKSSEAPRTMDAAVEKFFPEHTSWDLSKFRRNQAEGIQIVADGPPRESAVIVYDDGEGQHPDNFENTFLSLVRGNKNEIQFVQGKYNMGGSGAIIYCGKKRYQLIASKRFDGTGDFGFTLTREHPLSTEQSQTKKNTWYEFLKIDGQIPRFKITELDLGLLNRKFKTGTVIKLYSYQMKGISGFAQELNQSLNEFLFKPILPFLTVDNKERYPNNKVLDATAFGLQRRLEDESDYVEDKFSETYDDALFGKMKVRCYVFRPKQAERDVKESKRLIRERFFKNNMTVLFTMNGQVHGHYTSEFITRGLKFNLLKDYLLIEVDCTNMKYEFRKELFMASRDRLKEGDEANQLRDYLRRKLVKSKLDDINKRRKDSIGLESEDANELIKSFAKNLPKDSELFKLLQNTLKLEEKKKEQPKEQPKKDHPKKEEKPFKPERFPSFFRFFKKDNENENKPINIPVGGEKDLKFETDVEDNYFDRSEEPGDIEVSILSVKKQNETTGGTAAGTDRDPGELINIVKSSPDKGSIKITVNPNSELRSGDEIEIKASLKGPGEPMEEIVLLKITDPEAPKTEVPTQQEDLDNIGLPELIRVNQEQWENLEARGISMDYNTVMYPEGSGDKLEKIYVNMDSHVYLNHRKKLKSEDQISTSQKKYVSSIYFHSLFLYMITKRKNYKIVDEAKDDDVTVDDYIRDVFDSYYSDFLLNFGMEQLMNAMED